MMDIRILPPDIANMIAAGEVVQRSASVVKELMENAVDAGADKITVEIADAGRTLIRVSDNGSGMSPDEAVLCFERHATSKIAGAEDLERIMTFGFRGEALASIAAVAEVTLRTRREEDEVGCEVVFAASEHISASAAAAPKGSSFSVRNLFYNIPARRKFLKSDNIEFKHIAEEFTRVALTRPESGFTLIHNGREIFVLKPAPSLKFRIQDILGSRVAGELADLSEETSVVKVNGFVGRPESARKGQGNQYFFVNGRYFRSPYFHKAVMKAYENLVPDGATPPYFIYLEVDPNEVDVNIHPAKTEMKFENETVIFPTLSACVRQALGLNSAGDNIEFDRAGLPEMPVFTRNADSLRPFAEPQVGIDPSYNPFDHDGFAQEPLYDSASPRMSGKERYGEAASGSKTEGGRTVAPPHGGYAGTAGLVDRNEGYGKLFEEVTMPSKSVLVLKNRYIMAAVPSGLLVVNIRRAKERILYDRFLTALSGNAHVTQTALFPVTVQIGVENMMLFEENEAMLKSLGFDISPFGPDTIVVNGVPEGYSTEPGKVDTMVFDLAAAMSDERGMLPGTMNSAMAERFARLGACSDSPVSSTVEAQRLIDALFASGNAEYTSSGRRILTIMPTEEFDKKLN